MSNFCKFSSESNEKRQVLKNTRQLSIKSFDKTFSINYKANQSFNESGKDCGKSKNKEIKVSLLFYPIVFIIVSLLAEAINFIYLGFGILPKYIAFDLAFFLFVAGLIYLAPKKWMKLTIFYIFFGLQIIVNCVNVTMNKVFGDVLSLDMLKLGNEAVSAFSFEFLDFVNIGINLALIAISILIIVGIEKKVDFKTLFTPKRKFALLMCAVMTIWAFCGSFYFVGKASLVDVEAKNDLYIIESDVYLYDSLFIKKEAFKKFGTFGFYCKSLENLVLKNGEDVNREELSKYINQGAGTEIQSKYSGIAKDDNLIVIMLESFEWFAIDPIYTPTLYKLRTEMGYSLENFYGRNKTNVSEDIAIMGSMPKNSMLIDYFNKVGINVPYSLPNLFKKNSTKETLKSDENGGVLNAVSANYFHGYLETFYNRDKINISLGFDDVIGLEDTNVPYKSSNFGEWVKDSDFIKANIDKFIPSTSQPFFNYYTTIGTHGSYDNEQDAYSEYYAYFDNHIEEYKEYLKTTNYILPENELDYKHLRNYKSTAMDTDKMVKYILDTLEEQGKLETTTLVLFADHNCYYHDTTNAVKGIDKSDYKNIALYNIPFIIYNDKIEAKQDETFCNTYDIYPTICDMFGFKINTSLTQGYSIFSEDIKDSVFVSFLNGTFNQNFYTTNVVDVDKISDGVSDDDLIAFQLNVVNFYLKQQQIENIFKINYFGTSA